MVTILNNKIVIDRNGLNKLGISMSNSTLLRLEAKGQFPRRIRFGAHSVAWLADEVHAHIASLAAAREVA
ncbi:AlpA family transcriptional regulator [Novosphingobium sp. FSW06-99]|uniref:helix-turn-helix transcriptional regulator n=1 Tax=Novosphingobium sp. FSW06-99 TaxID=1739113 RepID=UPI001E3CC2B6|nr:AlpA family phage regulatory protein [Novosphingobium sp. FSW06-99]